MLNYYAATSKHLIVGYLPADAAISAIASWNEARAILSNPGIRPLCPVRMNLAHEFADVVPVELEAVPFESVGLCPRCWTADSVPKWAWQDVGVLDILRFKRLIG
jgi:hypothetical protein